MASLPLSPTSALDSVDALTYVPMPPFHSRSTGAERIAFIRSAGVILLTPWSRPSAARTCGVIGTDLALRAWIPPPAEISEVSESAQELRGSSKSRRRSA